MKINEVEINSKVYFSEWVYFKMCVFAIVIMKIFINSHKNKREILTSEEVNVPVSVIDGI